jgi:hypothetical protein
VAPSCVTSAPQPMAPSIGSKRANKISGGPNVNLCQKGAKKQKNSACSASGVELARGDHNSRHQIVWYYLGSWTRRHGPGRARARDAVRTLAWHGAWHAWSGGLERRGSWQGSVGPPRAQ